MSDGQQDEWLRGSSGRGAKPKDIRVRAPRKRQSGGSGPGARLAASRRSPEAVVKVISFASSQGSAMGLVDYVTRKGELTFETKDGEKIEGRDDEDGTKQLVGDWAERFSGRANARNAAHLMVSAPAGSSPEAVERAARDFAKRALGDDFDYGFALHTDEDHPHVHIVVVREEGGPVLDWNRHDLQDMRETFAEACREQGIEMTATPRQMRGQGEKGERMAPRKIREREGTNLSDRRAAEEVLEQEAIWQPNDPTRPWERAMADRAEAERAEYDDLARSFMELAALGRGEKAVKAAKLVRRQAMALRLVQTRRDRMREIASKEKLFQERDRARAAVRLATSYREDREARQERERQIAPASHEAMRTALEGFEAEVSDELKERVEEGSEAARTMRERLDRTLKREREAADGRDDRELE